MLLKIEATDTLFFRDGKPNIIGVDNWSDAQFPPNPTVLYGALRTAYFAQNPTAFEQLNDSKNPLDVTSRLKIRGIYLVTDEGEQSNIIYPIPKDCVLKSNGINLTYNSWIKEKQIHSQSGISYLNIFDESDKVEIAEGYISDLDRYSRELLDRRLGGVYSLTDLMSTEYRIGIGLNNSTHTAQESMIYRVEQNRMANRGGGNISFIVDCNLDEIKAETVKLPLLCRLGSEGKTVKLSEYNGEIGNPFPSIEKDLFKLLLLTPGIFKQGWLPDSFSKNKDGKYRGVWNGILLELVSAFIGKVKHVGGFDIKLRQPKPMYKAVPEGSVYYFKIIKGDKKELLSRFHNQNISDLLAAQGFGYALVCSLNKLPNYG